MASFIVERPQPLPQPEPQIHLALSPAEANAVYEFIEGDHGREFFLVERRQAFREDGIYDVIRALKDALETLESA